jgi:Translocon-associated protein beta (TRAPB)
MAGGARAFMLAIILVLLTSCVLRVARADDVDVAAVLSEEEDEYVDPSAEVAQQATLVVHKRVTQRYLVKGRNMTVQVAMYNVGNGCASFALRPPSCPCARITRHDAASCAPRSV